MIVWHDSWFDRINQLSSKPTPSCSGPGTASKALGPISQLPFTIYAPFSGLQTTPTGLRIEIPMELWCYIGRASPGTVCLALTDTKQWVLFICQVICAVVEYVLEVVS